LISPIIHLNSLPLLPNSTRKPLVEMWFSHPTFFNCYSL
jgi:hypothetical protein